MSGQQRCPDKRGPDKGGSTVLALSMFTVLCVHWAVHAFGVDSDVKIPMPVGLSLLCLKFFFPENTYDSFFCSHAVFFCCRNKPKKTS